MATFYFGAPWEVVFVEFVLFDFLFPTVTETITEIAISSYENKSNGIRWEKKLSNAEYLDDVMLLSDDPNRLRAILNSLDDKLGTFGMRAAYSKWRMLLWSKISSEPNRAVTGEGSMK